MGKAKEFNSISAIPRCDAPNDEDGVPNYPAAFDIMVSSDGENYITVKEVRLEKAPSDMIQTYDFDMQNARYIRLNVTKAGPYAADESIADPYRIQLTELMVFKK